MTDVRGTLQRVREILQRHRGESSSWVASLIERCGNDEPLLHRSVNSKRVWAGAVSIANLVLADNPAVDALTLIFPQLATGIQ